MSTTTTEPTTADVKSDEKNEESSDTTTTGIKQTDNKSMKKVRSKKDIKNDPGRFESPGVNFNAKLIGIDEVVSARGDKMCQESIQRLKLAVKSSGQHKQKIIVNVSLEGVRLIDLRSQAVNHSHLVHRISFISRDVTDSRAFGYVYGAGEGKHKFYAIKTEKAAEALVLTLRDLFQVVYDMKKKEVEEAKHKQETETIEKADEAKEGTEPVYQVPKSGAVVENAEDPTYQVPTNNAPVDKTEDNLLNLENELESIEKGIEQMNDLEDMFSDLRSPTTTMPQSSSTWGDELSSLSSPPAPTQPTFSVGGAPFSTPGSMTAVGSAGMFGAAAGPPAGGLAHQQWGAPQTGMAIGGAFPSATPNPFGGPSVPPRTGSGMLEPPAGHPHPHAGHPHPGGLPPTPFPGQAQFNRPSFPTGQPQTAMATTASDPFGNDPFAVGDSGGFGDNLLTPDKIETATAKEEATTEPQGKKDAFGDLVEIGSKNKPNISPKQMFVDLATPPKKSLNELKVETTPSPKPASPLGFQASEGTSPTPDLSTQAQLGDPFGGEDPFTNVTPNVNQNNTATAPSQNINLGAPIFDDDFNLPAPKGAPPPLPVNLGSVSTAALNIPPPPHRTDITVHHNTQTTPPLPPRPVSDVSRQTTSNNNNSECVPETPPLPPRLYLQKPDNSVPNNSLSKLDTKDKDSDTVGKPQADSVGCSQMFAEIKIQDNTQLRHNVSDFKPTPNVVTNELSPGEGLHESPSISNKGEYTQVKDDTELTQTSSGGVSQHYIEKNSKNLIHGTTAVNQNRNKPIIIDQDDNCDTDRISVISVSDESAINKKPLVDSSVDHNFNKMSFSSVSDPFVSVDPFASEDPFAQQTDPFSAADPFACDPFSDSISTTSVSSSSSNDPFTSTFTSQMSSHASVDSTDDPFSVFDNTFEPFHFDKTKKSKNKLKQQAGQ